MEVLTVSVELTTHQNASPRSGKGPFGDQLRVQTVSHLQETKHRLVNWACEDKIAVLW